MENELQVPPDGDPEFPGGIGCPFNCDGVWGSGTSLDRHLVQDHQATIDEMAQFLMDGTFERAEAS